MKDVARKLGAGAGAAVERSTRPTGRRLTGWIIALTTYVVLDAFDVLDLHIHLDPGALEQIGLGLQHLGIALLAIPAIITGFRLIKRTIRGPKH